MNYLFLVPISLLLASVALLAFLWTLNREQYEDLDGAAARILIDDDVPVTDTPNTSGNEASPLTTDSKQ